MAMRNGIRIASVGQPCCECPDYVDFFKSLKEVSENLDAIALQIAKAQDAYRQQLSYVRFSLQAPIVGSVGPNDTDRIA